MSIDTKPVFCLNCYEPMLNLSKGVYYHWLCRRCGLEHKEKPDAKHD